MQSILSPATLIMVLLTQQHFLNVKKLWKLKKFPVPNYKQQKSPGPNPGDFFITTAHNETPRVPARGVSFAEKTAKGNRLRRR